MIIIETCTVCGHNLQDLVICTNPPIPRKECHYCGWSWEGKQHREEVIRVPFSEPDDVTILNNINFEDARISTFENQSCTNCSNNPKNDGSGICFCILGQPEITC